MWAVWEDCLRVTRQDQDVWATVGQLEDGWEEVEGGIGGLLGWVEG